MWIAAKLGVSHKFSNKIYREQHIFKQSLGQVSRRGQQLDPICWRRRTDLRANIQQGRLGERFCILV